MMAEDTDIELVQRVQDGDVTCFGLLYDRYIESIYRFVYYKTHHTQVAEDLVSLIFMKALDSIQSYQTKRGSFKTWLYQIARHAIVDHYRSEKAAIPIEDAWDLSDTYDAEEALANEFAFQEVKEYLRQLSSIQRDIITMRLWQDMSYQEIGLVLQKTEASCKMQYKRGIETLRELMPLAVFFSFLLHRPHI